MTTGRLIGSVLGAVLTLLLLKAMLPSSGDPEDVVRVYLGHLRGGMLAENYNLISSDSKQLLEQERIYDEYGYFDSRLMYLPRISKYQFIDRTEGELFSTITAEVRLYQERHGPLGILNQMRDYLGPAIDTLSFELVNEEDGWRIARLVLGDQPMLP